MTIEEKLEMYREKKTFIDNISKAFEAKHTGSPVSSIKYEVYRRDFGIQTCFREYLVVHFVGGAISVRFVSGNSNAANFIELASLIEGGYYDEVEEYKDVVNSSEYSRVQFSSPDNGDEARIYAF